MGGEDHPLATSTSLKTQVIDISCFIFCSHVSVNGRAHYLPAYLRDSSLSISFLGAHPLGDPDA
jgi:hypothetical protein